MPLYTYQGNLEVYYETGMECRSLILLDDRGKKPNPMYDPLKTGWPFDLKQYHDIAWGAFLGKGDFLEVYENGEVIWSGILQTDLEEMRQTDYRYSFIPLGIERKEWLRWFSQELQAKVITKQEFPNEKTSVTP